MTSGRIALTVAPDHPAFAGHFPGQPIVPGVVLLDLTLVAVGQALGRDLSVCRIDSVKFFSPVGPGEPVQVQYQIQDSGVIRFELSSAGMGDSERKVAAGSIRGSDRLPPSVA